MIITTSQTVEGRQISEYLGIVSAAQVMVLAAGEQGGTAWVASRRGWGY